MSNNNLNYVRFDVGHYLYVCHKNTLMRFEDSVLAKYISPSFDRRVSEMDYITIDRDGKHFGSIINYMRDTSSLDLTTWSQNDLTDLLREADFYCISTLVELCDTELSQREMKKTQEVKKFDVPSWSKLEIIYGYDTISKLLQSSEKPVIVISYRSMRKFHIDSWFEELVKMSDHDRYKICCFADKQPPPRSLFSMAENQRGLSNFIVTHYDPKEKRSTLTISAPEYEKFRNRRDHYKCKIFKFWFIVLNDPSRYKEAKEASSSTSSPSPTRTEVIRQMDRLTTSIQGRLHIDS